MIAVRSREGDSNVVRRASSQGARRRATCDGSTKDFEVRHAPAAHEDDAARAVAADGLTLRACRTATLELIKQLAGRLEPHRERTLAPSRNGACRGRTRSLVRCPRSRGDRYERRMCKVFDPSLTSYEFVSSEARRAPAFLVGWMWAWRILFQLPLTSGFYTSSRRPRPERGRSATARGGAGVGPPRAGQLIARTSNQRPDVEVCESPALDADAQIRRV